MLSGVLLFRCVLINCIVLMEPSYLRSVAVYYMYIATYVLSSIIIVTSLTKSQLFLDNIMFMHEPCGSNTTLMPQLFLRTGFQTRQPSLPELHSYTG